MSRFGAGWTGTVRRHRPACALPWRLIDSLRGGTWPICVVAFHRVWDGSRDELSYPPAAFAELCGYWRDHYEMLSLDRVMARLARGGRERHPTLAITFDDGYADNAEIAAPVLDKLGLQATFFVTTGAIGTRRKFAWDAHLPEAPRLMSWHQVRELHRAGFGIGSHTVSHARLAETRGPALAAELESSRERLEAELGEPAPDFAYPFGLAADCDDTARSGVAAAGYRSCFSCDGGLIVRGDSPYRLRRVCISPRYHATPAAWARAYTRLRWQTASRYR